MYQFWFHPLNVLPRFEQYSSKLCMLVWKLLQAFVVLAYFVGVGCIDRKDLCASMGEIVGALPINSWR